MDSITPSPILTRRCCHQESRRQSEMNSLLLGKLFGYSDFLLSLIIASTRGLHSQQIMLLMRSALIYFGAVWECIKQCTWNFTLCSSCGGLPFNQHLMRESWTRPRQGSCTAILIHPTIIMPFTWCLFCSHLPLLHNHHQFSFQWFCLLSRWWTISRR